jgi:glutamate-1-semialdehyde 2,1-aminomutase
MYKNIKKNTKKLQKYAHDIIPGLSGLLGKRPEMYLPGGAWPTYYKKAKGIKIWGIDGKKYLDFTMVGIGTSVLGYADKEINKAAFNAINSGSMTTLNPPEDVELAEELLKIHPWAGSVKYARTGGESMSIAVRLSRAFTGKDKILFCGYHGWHDWYLSTNLKSKKKLDSHLLPGLEPLGVPKGLAGSTIPFKFNDWKDLNTIVKKKAKDCAAIILEPCRETFPDKKYLKEIRKIASKNNCVLIFDEITSGWRINTGGAHQKFKINPDIVVYGKTIANGIPMGAIVGKKKIISLALKTFVSSSFWSEKIGPSCALTFIKKHKKLNLGKKLNVIGLKIKKIWNDAAKKNNLEIDIFGINPLATFKLKTKNWPITITFFIQEMLKYNILASDRCYANYAHDKKSLNIYKKACEKVFKNIADLEKKGTLKKHLESPIKQMGFTRLT